MNGASVVTVEYLRLQNAETINELVVRRTINEQLIN